MGRYDPRAIFDKEPAVIAGGVKIILHTLILAGVLQWDAPLLAGVSIALEGFLRLFVRQTSTPNVTVAEIVKTPPTAAGPIAAAEAAGVDTTNQG